MNLDKARQALKDPEVLALMRKDPRFAEYFDAEGNLNLDITGPDGSHRSGTLWSKFFGGAS